MSDKKAKKFRKLYKGIAKGKVDHDLETMIRRYRTMCRFAWIKTTLVVALGIACAVLIVLLASTGR